LLSANKNAIRYPKHMDKWFSWGQEDEDDFDFI
jgi:hypothetical protein